MAYADNPSISPRIERDGHYVKKSRGALENILETTYNAHEYLAACLALWRETGTIQNQTALAELLEVATATISHSINGRNLPSLALAKKCKEHATQLTPFNADRFEDLVIRNHLEMICATKQPKQRARLEEQLPQRYWNSLLAQVANEDISAPALWADKLIPIETQGAYLRALRGSLGKSAGEIPNLNNLMVLSLESGSNLYGYSDESLASARTTLEGFYRDYCSAYDNTIYAALPRDTAMARASWTTSLPNAQRFEASGMAAR